jgi:hypothetical protein
MGAGPSGPAPCVFVMKLGQLRLEGTSWIGMLGAWAKGRRWHEVGTVKQSEGVVRALGVVGAVVATLVIISGCGGRSSQAAHVGGVEIQARTVSHWARVIGAGAVVPGVPARKGVSARTRAVEFLILSQWLIGEAKESGLTTANAGQSLIDEGSGLREALRETGETASDIALTERAEVAIAFLRRSLASRRPVIGRSQVAAYYTKNVEHLSVPERREFLLAEGMADRATAEKIKREVAHGRSLAQVAYHESLSRPNIAKLPGDYKRIVKAVFTTPLGVVVGPMRLYKHWALYEVTGRRRSIRRSLSQVYRVVADRLEADALRQSAIDFARAWRAKWTPKTDCSPGFVVQQCDQYAGLRSSGVGPFGTE